MGNTSSKSGTPRRPRVAENAPAVFERQPDIALIQERFRKAEKTVSELMKLVSPRCDEVISPDKPQETSEIISEARRLASEMFENIRSMERLFWLPENFVSALERIGKSVSSTLCESTPEFRRFRMISESLELLRKYLWMDYAGIWLIKDERNVALHESGALHPQSDMAAIDEQVKMAIEGTKDGRFAFLDPSDSLEGGVDAVFVFRNIEGIPIGYLLLDDYHSAHDIDLDTVSEVAETYYVHLHAIIHEESAALSQKELLDVRCTMEKMRIELENSRIELENSRHDLLTGLLLRRYWTEKIEHRMEQVLHARNRNERGALCLFDIDKFKRINDTYGHDKGDEVLTKVWEILTKGYHSGPIDVAPRKIDVICRWWGEEFAAYLEKTDEAGGIVFAERISKAIQDLVFEDPNGGPPFHISVTMGLVSFDTDELRRRPHGKSLLCHYMKLADEALYEGKGGGRNRIMLRKPDGSYETYVTGKSVAP